MRILLVQNMMYIPEISGATRVNRALMEGLARRGHHCRMLTLSRSVQGYPTDRQFLEELARRGVRPAPAKDDVHAFHRNGVEIRAAGDLIALKAEFERQVTEFDPACVVASCEDTCQMLLGTALRVAPSRVVYLVQATWHLPFGPDGFLTSSAGTALVKQAAGIVVTSLYLQRYIRHWGGLDSSYIPVGTISLIDDSVPHLGRWGRGGVTMVNPCAIKGISIFLALARALPHVGFAAVPTWGTTGRDLVELRQRPNVQVLAPSENIDEIFKQTQVLLVPSLLAEAFGRTAPEAMLRGIPVLASHIGGLPEAKLGLDYILPVRPIERYELRGDDRSNPIPVVPDQDVRPWLAALREVLTSRERYESLSLASRDAVRQAFPSDEVILAAFEQSLVDVAGQASHAGRTQHEISSTPSAAASLETLSPQRRALLLARVAKRLQTAPRDPVVTRPSRPAQLPLSDAQERLWFLHQIAPDNTAYNMSVCLRINGPLDVAALERSVNEIVRRHEILRTTFTESQGRPIQEISSESEMAIRKIDLAELPTPQRAEQMKQRIDADTSAPFDLRTGPLLRPLLLKLAPEEHVLVLTIHHIIADRWSIAVFFRELDCLYEAFLQGGTSPLPPLSVQYADFAVQQKQSLAEGRFEAGLDYWCRRLRTNGTPMEIPTDHPHPAVPGRRGGYCELPLSRTLTGMLKKLSERCSVTPFMTLLAAFEVVLSRYTGRDDITVGTPVANRSRKEAEPLIGLFVNNLVLRMDLAGDPSFETLLQRARQCVLEAFEHQDVPFGAIVERLRPQRDMSRTPFFQVLFNMLGDRGELPRLRGTQIEWLSITPDQARFDLALHVEEYDGEFRLKAVYSADLFEADTIARMLHHLWVVLEAAVNDPAQSISRLSILTEAERRQVLYDWNETTVDFPNDRCVHEWIEDRARRTPDQTAVRCAGQSLRYSELNDRADRLAAHLIARGIGPEIPVGIFMERSFDLVVALLAVLKAGGAYIPLDPDYPPQRIHFMIGDAAPPIVLTQKHLLSRLLPCDAQLLPVDAPWPAVEAQSGPGSPRPAHPDNLAYIIYTSGSTGTPKGVMITHCSLCNLLDWMQRTFQLSHEDAVLQTAPFSFDVSVWEFLWPLTAGARLVLPAPGRCGDSAYLADCIRAENVTTLHFVPATLQLFLEQDGIEQCTSLRRVLCGGETLPGRLQHQFFARLSAQLHNMYGPTETTIDVTHWACRRQGQEQTVPIGCPAANTQTYILDRHLEPVPVGIPGELYIGGVQVARGYLNRPDLTATRFLPDPFSRDPKARLYRTGDLARHRPDGSIEFLGRVDRQVKVRGCRIEPAEIEAALKDCAGVKNCVVAVLGNTPDEQYLAAYLVCSESVSSLSLRRYLRTRLPEYMIPSRFFTIEQIPLLPNQKVDFEALSRIASGAPTQTREHQAPETPAERRLAAIWKDLLQVQAVGANDNFFDLGGHSLMAIRLMARMECEFGRRVEFRNLMYGTLGQLAADLCLTGVLQNGS